MKIVNTLSELLFEYDCVVIPGFGGFIGNYYPATILSANHSFLPPSKTLLFNINLRQNDGLLATRLAGNEKVSYHEALDVIEQEVTEWNRNLVMGNRIELAGIGQFFHDSEGNTQFTQVKEVNFLNESYGLTSFVSPLIKREGLQKKLEKKINGYLESSPNSRRMVPRALKWAAVLALPLGTAAFFGVTNFEKIKSLSTEYAGILLPGPASSIEKTVPANKPVTASPKPSKVLQSIIPAKEEVKEAMTKQPVVSTTGNYSIIIGAFRFKENAEKLVVDLVDKGYDAAIVGQTRSGLHRVQLRSFSSKEEAVQQLAMVRSSEYPGAWLLIK